MTVINRLKNLLENVCRHFLRERIILTQSIEQISSRAVLRNYMNMLLGLKVLINFKYIRMVKSFKK